MHKFISTFVVTLLFLPALLSAADDNVVAKVGEVPVTSFEVERRATRIIPFNSSFHGGISAEKKEEVREEALSDLILRAYKICYGISLKIKVPEDQVNDKIEKIKAKFKTPEQLAAATDKETLVGLKESITRGLLADISENVAVESKISVSDKQVLEYYEENKHMYFQPQQYRASHIFIKVDPSADEITRAELYAKAEGLEKQAKAGENFYNLAYYNSDDSNSYVGGDIGVFHEGQAGKPLENALKKMEVGDISGVVESLHGLHIIKLTQKDEPRQKEFEEVRPKIRSMLEKKQREVLYEEWIQNLKATYKVVRFDS